MSFLLGLVDTIAVGFAQYALRATMTLQVGKYMFSCPQIIFTKDCGIWQFSFIEYRILFQSGLPVFTGPFALTSLLVLATSDTKGNLYRVEKMSYPEKQCYEWHSGKKDTNTSWDYCYLRFSFTNNKISVIDLAQNKY